MNQLPHDHAARTARARLSLDGLSLGDAFCERFFGEPDRVLGALATRTVPRRPWGYTDDTVMALAVFEILERYGRIEQDALARAFGAKYLTDPNRGYGAGAHRVLGTGAFRPNGSALASHCRLSQASAYRPWRSRLRKCELQAG